MKNSRILCALGLALTCGCAHQETVSLPPGARIAVFPAKNRTGDELFVSGSSALEKYVFRSDRVTVPQLLAAGARFELSGRGFSLVPPDAIESAAPGQVPQSAEEAAALAAEKKIDAAVLFLDLWRWEPDAPFHPAYVLTALDATLIDPKTGVVLWKASLSPRPEATRGTVILGDAYVQAARQLMARLFRPWKPGTAPTATASPGNNGAGP